MNRFNIGDKVYSKEGSGSTGIGTVCKLDDEKVSIRLFRNLEIVEFWASEILNQEESRQKQQESISGLPHTNLNNYDF